MKPEIACLAAIWFLTCAGSHTTELEAKAEAGDAEAACQLAVDDLKQCLEARTAWESEPSSAPPACLDKPVPDAHRAYLADAIKPLIATPSQRWSARIAKDAIEMAAANFQNAEKRQEVESLIASIPKLCPELHN